MKKQTYVSGSAERRADPPQHRPLEPAATELKHTTRDTDTDQRTYWPIGKQERNTYGHKRTQHTHSQTLAVVCSKLSRPTYLAIHTSITSDGACHWSITRHSQQTTLAIGQSPRHSHLTRRGVQCCPVVTNKSTKPVPQRKPSVHKRPLLCA